MELIKILELIPDESNVYVVNRCDQMIACYDGKNSIPNELNGETVIKLEPLDHKSVTIMIDIEQEV